jgi:hypothetical protein
VSPGEFVLVQDVELRICLDTNVVMGILSGNVDAFDQNTSCDNPYADSLEADLLSTGCWPASCQ